MRRSLSLALLLTAVSLAAPSMAGAYVLSGSPWPSATVTYRADGARAATAARYAARTWNTAGVGVRFRRVTGPADVVVAVGHSVCSGEATVGHTSGAWVKIGRCRARLQALVATHEFGHVLGLGHERRRCALMNTYLAYPSGTPARCNRRPLTFWLASPLRGDDIRGARALHR